MMKGNADLNKAKSHFEQHISAWCNIGVKDETADATDVSIRLLLLASQVIHIVLFDPDFCNHVGSAIVATVTGANWLNRSDLKVTADR